MATLTEHTKPPRPAPVKEVLDGVTLRLTNAEALVLRAIVGYISGSGTQGNGMGIMRDYTSQIYCALAAVYPQSWDFCNSPWRLNERADAGLTKALKAYE